MIFVAIGLANQLIPSFYLFIFFGIAVSFVLFSCYLVIFNLCTGTGLYGFLCYGIYGFWSCCHFAVLLLFSLFL